MSIIPQDEIMSNERPSFRLRLQRINAVDLVVMLAVAYCLAFWSALVSNPDIEMVHYVYERIGFTAPAQQVAFVSAGVAVFVLYLLTGEAKWTGIALIPGGAYTFLLTWHSMTRVNAQTSVYAVTAVFMWAALFTAILVANHYQDYQEQVTRMIEAAKDAPNHEQ